MTHFEHLLLQADQRCAEVLARQITDSGSDHFGAFVIQGYHIDTRVCGFMLSDLITCYLIPQSRYYQDQHVKSAIQNGIHYLLEHTRPGGCLDLTACNFASAPDTAFTLNAIISTYWLLDRDDVPDHAWLRVSLRTVIEKCAEGVMNGGFHTPNHRWAIAACLLHAGEICHREDFIQKAHIYLGEGLDIDEDGEYAERSAGNYNQVNNDQMIRLYLATGDKTYLEAVRSNLLMMLHYIDPDDSVFTNNSTRQDYGKKVYLESYYFLFLLAGYLLHDRELAAYAEYCWDSSVAKGQLPHGIVWYVLYPELEAYGKSSAADRQKIEHYAKLFPHSKIARARFGDFSCTVMAGRPNFLYFQHGSNTLYLDLYSNVCDKRNFVPETIEQTSEGFRVSGTVDSWYYLPFDGNGPETTDWWAMDNASTREKLITDKLQTSVEIRFCEDGVDVEIRSEGLSGVPFRLEWGIMADATIRNEHFLIQATRGESMTVCAGTLQIENAAGDVITIDPAFARHNVQHRMGGAYPLSSEHFTVFFTDYAPFVRHIHLGIKPVFGQLLS